MNSIERLRAFREAGNVERSHCIPHLGSYTNGKHTFDMLLLLDVLYPGTPPPALIRSILYHDTHERWTGDLPGPALAQIRALRVAKTIAVRHVEHVFAIPRPALTSEEATWLDAVDKLEFLLWCEDEAALGNRNVEEALAGQKRHFMEKMDYYPEEIRRFFLGYNWKRFGEDIPNDGVR